MFLNKIGDKPIKVFVIYDVDDMGSGNWKHVFSMREK